MFLCISVEYIYVVLGLLVGLRGIVRVGVFCFLFSFGGLIFLVGVFGFLFLIVFYFTEVMKLLL